MPVAGVKNPAVRTGFTNTPIFAVHGSIQYEGIFESNIDTPYLAKNLYQHTLRTGLDVVYKNKYPLRVYFTTRFSNSNLLKNIVDVNFKFSSRDFQKVIKENIQRWGSSQIEGAQFRDSVTSVLRNKRKELDMLNRWLASPSLLQQSVEAKEREMAKGQLSDGSKDNKKPDELDSLSTDQIKQLKNWRKGQRQFDENKEVFVTPNKYKKNDEGKFNDSLKKPFLDGINAGPYNDSSIVKKRNRRDSLLQQISLLESALQKQQMRRRGEIDSLVMLVNQSKNPQELSSALGTMNVPDSILPKGYKSLLAIKSVGIGRTTVNYSELSVKNISVQGVQATYNPRFYFAFAAGVIDYRFRDFVVNQNEIQKQYLGVVRFGKGIEEGNHMFITYYTGKKQLYSYIQDTGTVTTQQAHSQTLMGITLERRYQFSNSTYLLAEAAKSSLPYYNRQQTKQSVLGGVFNFNDRSNEAYSLKFVTMLPSTLTKITGFYKHFGNSFQSFSIYTTSSAQNAWYLRVDQPFFKKRLLVNASIKKNDFTNPYAGQQFYSNTVFKSLQATLHIKKWPVVSAGYYPASQISKLGNGQYIENLYYTLAANATYSYHLRQTMMNTFFSYTKFYNKSADTGFVYFNTHNFLLSQGFFFKRLTVQLNIAVAKNNAYMLYTAGGDFQYIFFKWLSAGAGLKYNIQTVTNNRQAGYNASATIKIPGFGDIQFLAQKAYMPGINKQLVENDIGRLTYYKSF